MIKKTIVILILGVFLLNIGACGSVKKKRYEAEFLVLFDTLTQIVAYTESKKEFTRHSQLIYDNLKEYHELYNIYNDFSGINNIKTINDNAGIKPVKVNKKIIDLLLFAKKEYKNTQGKMNVAFGAVLKIWHKYRTEGIDDQANAALPSMDILREAAKHTDINKVIINETNSTVFLDDAKMSLDVGAVAKGYAVEQVTQVAIKNGFTSGIISVGGNVRAIGNKGNGNNATGNKVSGNNGAGNNGNVNGLWNLGIQNPDKESEKTTINIVYLTDLSLVSSGDYERYYTVNGKRYHHIIDPDTLFPAQYFSAVTIICKDSGIADSLSTAVFNLPFDKGLKYINDLPDTEALWVMKNGEIRYSENFKKYLK